MTVLRSPHFIFYHIPRTGGSWVTKALKASVKNHLKGVPGNGTKNEFGIYYGHKMPSCVNRVYRWKRFAFCFVRHPIAWYKSFWCLRVRVMELNNYATMKPGKHVLDKYWSEDWTEFINNVLSAYPDGFASRLFRGYVGENKRQVHFIGRQENLEEDLIKVLKLSGEEFDEDKIRKIKPVNVAAGYKKYGDQCKLSKELEDRIIKADKWTIDNFYGSDTQNHTSR